MKMPKKKPVGKTIEQMEKHIVQTEEEKDDIQEFTEKHIKPKPAKKTNHMWLYILVVCCVLMALAMLERNKILAVVSGMGFILLILGWMNKQIFGGK